MANIDELLAEVIKSWRPPKRMSLSQWSDEHAYLSAESAAQEGRWRTLPYQRAIMDAMTDPTVEQIVVMKSARVGYTKMLNNLIGYHIHQDPCAIMVVQPTIEDAEGYSKEEIAPMIRDTPVLRNLVADAKSRDGNNTILGKSFAGGTLSLVGANSPRGFRRVSRRIVLFDEIDGYPPSAGAEGDQIKLGIRRSEYFWNRKIVMGSTPTVHNVSRVEREFEKTDQRKYFVPCPHCGEYQTLKWSGLKWPKGRPDQAYYECEHCHEHIEHHQKYDMIEKGEFRPTTESSKPGLIGFHIWAGYSYSPNASWGQLATEFVEAKGNPESLKTFVNTVLGETWREQGDRANDNELMQRAAEETYTTDPLPEEVLVITVGADVQPDRIELEVVGWGLGDESWSLDYQVLWGDPNEQLVWQQLDNYIAQTWIHPTGVILKPARIFVDSGGANTQAVYNYVRDRAGLGVYAIKGMHGDGRPAVGTPTKSNIGKIPLFPLGTFVLKDTVFGRLRISEPGPGYCHFKPTYGASFFKGMTAEEVRVKHSKGFPVREWVKVFDRNEPFDCRVYATAAFISLNLNMQMMHEMMNGTYVVQDQPTRKVRSTVD